MRYCHSSARQRLLDVAAALFYQEGVRSVGVDTIVEKSEVGKATLYRHFPTKDDLIVAYLEEDDRHHWQWFEQVIAPYEGSQQQQLLAWFEACTERLLQEGLRGCAFLNVLAEFAEVDHSVHQCAIKHEYELRARLHRLSQQAGARGPEQLADQLLLVSNGALTSAPLFGPANPATQLKAIATRLINAQFEDAQTKP